MSGAKEVALNFSAMFVNGNLCVCTVQVTEKIEGGRYLFWILKQGGKVSSLRKKRGRAKMKMQVRVKAEALYL